MKTSIDIDEENTNQLPLTDSDDDDDGRRSVEEETKNENLQTELRTWALDNKINHSALKDLLRILNKRFDNSLPILPQDPRTFLHTPKTLNIVKNPANDDGFWHHGLENCLKTTFCNLNEPITISLNVNVDGLPLYGSSSVEFWPILFNIAEMPKIAPMVIGIYCGKGKTTDLSTFFSRFVEEMRQILSDGVHINSHRITVRIRCFVCDSPARSYIKGKNIYPCMQNIIHCINNQF